MAVCRAALFRRFFSVYCGIVVPYSAAPMFGRCTAFWSCRCVFTYHMVCTSTSFTVPLWYRPIGEIARGCILSTAALPGKAVCSIYQFRIALIGEMAPGVPRNALNKIIQLHYRTGIREMAPIGEMTPGCAKKKGERNIKNPFAPGAISRMITVLAWNTGFQSNHGAQSTNTP